MLNRFPGGVTGGATPPFNTDPLDDLTGNVVRFLAIGGASLCVPSAGTHFKDDSKRLLWHFRLENVAIWPCHNLLREGQIMLDTAILSVDRPECREHAPSSVAWQADWGRSGAAPTPGQPQCSVAGFGGDNEVQGGLQQQQTALLADQVGCPLSRLILVSGAPV